MRIIIAGDGETGTYLAQMLSVENQDVVLMGTDKSRLDELDASGNFMTFEGSPVSIENLTRCGAERADVFVAVTPDESVNIIACEMAKECGARRCVARVDNPEFTLARVSAMLQHNGVDQIIIPEKVAAIEASRFIEHSWVSEWVPFHRGTFFVVGIRMEASGTLCGLYLRDIPSNPRKFHVAAIKRGNTIIIPRGDDMLLEGDTVYFSVLPENIGALPALCGKDVTPTRRMMITGAGRVTENLLELTDGKYNITVIDPDSSRCRTIAERFPDTVVINATANDILTLKEEGIEKCDTFLALTGSSETNIVSCMVAREHGVRRTLARIEELQYIPEAQSLAIDKIINKKLLNTGKVLSTVLDTNSTTAQCLSLDKAEVTEIKASPRSLIVSRPLSELSLPRGITIAGLIRDGVGQLAVGQTQIHPGDHVVVFSVSGSISKIEKIFR